MAASNLKPSLLGVSDGSPDVEDKLVGEGEVAERLVQSHGEFVRVLLVSADLHHRRSCRNRNSSVKVKSWQNRSVKFQMAMVKQMSMITKHNNKCSACFGATYLKEQNFLLVLLFDFMFVFCDLPFRATVVLFITCLFNSYLFHKCNIY